MAPSNKSQRRDLLWSTLLALTMVPVLIAAQDLEPVPDLGLESEPSPNPTRLLILPRGDQSTAQQLEDERECYDWACEQAEWDPYEAYDLLVAEGYVVALTRKDVEAGLISLAYDGAVTGSVAGDLLGNEDLGAEIGVAVAIAQAVVRSDYLTQPDSPEARRAVSGFERDLRYWERKFAACLRPKGYRVDR